MAFEDLREYIAILEKHGEVQRIEQEVDWHLEAGAILRRTYELGLPAPFFQKIKGYPKGYRMFGGTLASYRRLAIALGLHPDTGYDELIEVYLKRSRNLIKPRIVKDGPSKENIWIGDDVNLFNLPAPMLHEGDGGRYLCTWHINISKDPDSEWVNWGIYRAMILTENTLTGIILPRQHMGLQYHKCELRNQPMPFAIAIGTEPVCTMCAGSSMPYGVSEVEVAGGLQGEPVELVKCETVDLYVPATAEIVIEGEILPKERKPEGPFGEYTGYRVDAKTERPVYRVKAITHRHEPILTTCCVGIPVDENQLPMSVTSGAEILSELRGKGMPVVGLHHYAGCSLQLIVVSIKLTGEANLAQRVANIVRGTHAGRALPYLIVVEDDVDPGNINQVMHALVTKCHPIRGIHQQSSASGHNLQPFLNLHERQYGLGAAVTFDCTWPVDWDPVVEVPWRASFNNIYPKELQEYVVQNWSNYGFKVDKPQN
jgi:phenylphosphate carboxylase alpha subunit